MFLESSHIAVPEWFSRLCSIHLTNTKVCYGEMIDVVESDPFLRTYVKDYFKIFLQKGGHLGMLHVLGPQRFRNMLAEAVLVHQKTGKYPLEFELDYVQDILDIEARFGFLFHEGDSQVFLMGMFFKLYDMSYSEERGIINIPLSVDQLLKEPKDKSDRADWLIVTILSLIDIAGESFCEAKMKANNNNIDKVLELLTDDQQNHFISNLLKYGEGVHCPEFFSHSKIR